MTSPKNSLYANVKSVQNNPIFFETGYPKESTHLALRRALPFLHWNKAHDGLADRANRVPVLAIMIVEVEGKICRCC
jgi:hypothetical protein